MALCGTQIAAFLHVQNETGVLVPAVSEWKTYTHAPSSGEFWDVSVSFRYPPNFSLSETYTPFPAPRHAFLDVLATGTPMYGDSPSVVELTVLPDPPDTHIYENAISLPTAKDFVTDSGFNGFETVPGIFMFDTGERDPNGNKIIVQLDPPAASLAASTLGEEAAQTLTIATSATPVAITDQYVALPGTENTAPSNGMEIGGASLSMPMDNLALVIKQPSQLATDLAEEWLRYNGFAVDLIRPGSIIFSGTAEEVEDAFRMKIDMYLVGNGQCYISPDDQNVPLYLAFFVKRHRSIRELLIYHKLAKALQQ
jgi:hypothetical protein